MQRVKSQSTQNVGTQITEQTDQAQASHSLKSTISEVSHLHLLEGGFFGLVGQQVRKIPLIYIYMTVDEGGLDEMASCMTVRMRWSM